MLNDGMQEPASGLARHWFAHGKAGSYAWGQAHGAGGSVCSQCSQEGAGFWLLPVDPRHLWAPLQEQPPGMASSSPSQAARIHASPRAHPAAPPLFPIPGPAFHQMLGLEDETALPTPAPIPEAGSGHAG